MGKGVSLLTAAVVAAGIVAFGGMAAKAEAQGVTAVGLKLGYNYNVIEVEYRDSRGRTRYDTYTGDVGFHAGIQADIMITEIDLAGPCIIGINPSVLLSSKGVTGTHEEDGVVYATYDIDAYYIDVPVPVSFKWDLGGYAIGVEIGPYASFHLGGEQKARGVMVTNPGGNTASTKMTLPSVDGGIMAGVYFEFSNMFTLGLRAASGFGVVTDETVTTYYVTAGFNFWRYR